jgi:hypothetical protein
MTRTVGDPSGSNPLTGILSDRWMARLRWLTVATFAVVFGYFIAVSFRWAIVADEAAMHYVVFLIRHGRLPYSEITDMNMPGTYLTEQWAMAVFGWGDVSWRIYEYLLLAAMTVGATVIAGRERWIGGVYAAMFFILMHGSEGPHVALEREELMTALLLGATAALVLGVRKCRPVLVLVYGLLAGLAVSIKPTALLIDAALLLLLWMELRRLRAAASPYLLWGVAGNAAVFALVLGYLSHYHAVGAFVFVLRKVLPEYAGSTPHTFGFMLQNFVPTGLLPLVVCGVAAAVLRKERMGWERWAVLLVAGFGAFSYFIQGKGYLHHRYIFVMFLVLWVGVEAADAMRRGDVLSRAVGLLGVVALFLFAVPHYVRAINRDTKQVQVVGGVVVSNGIALTTYLDNDLEALGGDRLQGKVVCLDLLSSCLNGLYRMRLIENTSFTGDLLLWSQTETPLVDFYRKQFMALQQADPADVVVVSNEWFLAGRPDFRKLDTWPAYKAWLEANYVEVVERRLPGGLDAPAYRLYLRKGSAVLAWEQEPAINGTLSDILRNVVQ